MNAVVGARRPRPHLPPSDQGRGEAVVHAAAQLPDEVRFRLPRRAIAPHVRLALTAYGIEHRIDLTDRDGPLPTADTVGMLVERLWPAAVDASPTARDDGVLAGHRVALITNLPAHYRLALFAGMEGRLQAVGAAFSVCFLGSRDRRREWLGGGEGLSFGHVFVPGVTLPLRRRRRPRAPLGLAKQLRSYEPTIVLAAGFGASAATAACHAARRPAAYGIWSGEIAGSTTARSRSRRLQRRALTGRADFAVAYGAASAAYLRGLAPRLPVVIGRNTSPIPAGERQRRDAGPVRLLAVGDLDSPRKGIDTIIAALGLRPDLDCELNVIGAGRLVSALQRAAAADPRIRFLGSRSPAQVRDACSSSDAFLFPTRSDVFGLALVEAMGAGLATATSAAPGALQDLAVPGANCLVVRGHAPGRWAAAIGRLVEDPALRDSLGTAARATICRRWTLAHAVEGMMAGLRLGAEVRRQEAGC